MNTSTIFSAQTMASAETKKKLKELRTLYPPRHSIDDEYRLRKEYLLQADAAAHEHNIWLSTECANPEYRKVAYDTVVYTVAALEIFVAHGHGQIFDEHTPRSAEKAEEDKDKSKDSQDLLSYAGKVADELVKDALLKQDRDASARLLVEAECVAKLGLGTAQSLQWCWGYPGTPEPAARLLLRAEWNNRLARILRSIAELHEQEASAATRLVEIRNASVKQFRKAAAHIFADFQKQIENQAAELKNEVIPMVSLYSTSLPSISDGSYKTRQLHVRFESLISVQRRGNDPAERHDTLVYPERLAIWLWNNSDRQYPHPLKREPIELTTNNSNSFAQWFMSISGEKFFLNEVRCNIWTTDEEPITISPEWETDYQYNDPDPIVIRPEEQSIDEMIQLLPKDDNGDVNFQRDRQLHVYLNSANGQAPFLPAPLFKLVGAEIVNGITTHLVFEAKLDHAIGMSNDIVLTTLAADKGDGESKHKVRSRVGLLVAGRRAPQPDLSF